MNIPQMTKTFRFSKGRITNSTLVKPLEFIISHSEIKICCNSRIPLYSYSYYNYNRTQVLYRHRRLPLLYPIIRLSCKIDWHFQLWWAETNLMAVLIICMCIPRAYILYLNSMYSRPFSQFAKDYASAFN